MTMFSAAAFVVARGLRLGPLRATPYGLCAAIGLVSGMSLARRAAQRLGLDAEAVWDTGILALISCFVASRLLLILRDPVAFKHFPMLILGLPSLTFGGMLVAALMVFAYVRARKKLTLPALLDVYAAPAALLAAALEFGHWFDGSEVGMPTALPWGVRDPWTATPVPVHPVALYGVAGALLLAVGLWRGMVILQGQTGTIAALGLIFGGGLAFGLNLLTQPLLVPPELRLEPGQWMALGAMLAGSLLWTCTPARTALLSRANAAVPATSLHAEVR